MILLKPAGGFRLSSRNFAAVMGQALERGAALMLPPPPEPTLQDALAEGPDESLDDQVIEGVIVDPSDDAIERLGRGGLCDPRHHERQFMSLARLNRYGTEDGRAEFMLDYTLGEFDSLAEFLAQATEREATALTVALHDRIIADRAARMERGEPPPAREAPPAGARSYEDLFEDDLPEPVVGQPIGVSPDAVVEPAVVGEVVGSESPDPPRADEGTQLRRAEWEDLYVRWAAVLKRYEPQSSPPDPKSLSHPTLKVAVLETMALVDNARAALAALDESEQLQLTDSF
jgi:hypothetical protein